MFVITVSPLVMERLAHGSKKVSEIKYCKLKQVQVKLRIALSALSTRMFHLNLQTDVNTKLIHQVESYCSHR